jgi:hypothetical protein
MTDPIAVCRNSAGGTVKHAAVHAPASTRRPRRRAAAPHPTIAAKPHAAISASGDFSSIATGKYIHHPRGETSPAK